MLQVNFKIFQTLHKYHCRKTNIVASKYLPGIASVIGQMYWWLVKTTSEFLKVSHVCHSTCWWVVKASTQYVDELSRLPLYMLMSCQGFHSICWWVVKASTLHVDELSRLPLNMLMSCQGFHLTCWWYVKDST